MLFRLYFTSQPSGGYAMRQLVVGGEQSRDFGLGLRFTITSPVYTHAGIMSRAMRGSRWQVFLDDTIQLLPSELLIAGYLTSSQFGIGDRSLHQRNFRSGVSSWSEVLVIFFFVHSVIRPLVVENNPCHDPTLPCLFFRTRTLIRYGSPRSIFSRRDC